MSDAEPQPIEPLGPDFVDFPGGGLSTQYLWDDAQEMTLAGPGAPFDQEVADAKARMQLLHPGATVALYDQVWDFLQGAVDDGALTVDQVPQFIEYLRFNQGIPALTSEQFSDIWAQNLLTQWKESLGYFLGPSPLPGSPGEGTPTPSPAPAPAPAPTPVPEPNPPAPVPAPAPAPTPTPTPGGPVATPTPGSPVPAPTPSPTQQVTIGAPTTTGQGVVTSAASGVVNQTISGGGFTAAQAQAISTAVGISTADVYKVLAQALDLMFPGLGPGQVPAALTDLFNATHTLEHQLDPLVQGTRENGGLATGDQVQSIQAVLNNIQADVGTLQAQFGEEAPSQLGDDVEANKTATAANTSAIGDINATLPTLAPLADLAPLALGLGTLTHQMAGSEESGLGNALAATTTTANDALRVAEDAEACCDAQTANLSNLSNNLGGASGIANLLKMVKYFAELVAVGAAIDVVGAMFAPGPTIAAIISDTETVSGWVDKAAAQAVSSTGWLKTLAPVP